MSLEAWGDQHPDAEIFDPAIEAGWLNPDDLPKGLIAVMNERLRQQDEEGQSVQRDVAVNPNGELALAAACYALFGAGFPRRMILDMGHWPRGWGTDWFKTSDTDRRRALVKAGALILAELDRIDDIALLKGGAK